MKAECDGSARKAEFNNLVMARCGIPPVLIAAYIVRSLPLTYVRWLVVVVVVYAAAMMLRSAATERRTAAVAGAPAGR